MTDRRDEPVWVDDLLDDVARTPEAGPSGDFMARVLADAEAQLPRPGAVAARRGVMRQLLDEIGGWVSVGGLVAATAVGFAVGLGALGSAGLDALWLGDVSNYTTETPGLNLGGWDYEEG